MRITRNITLLSWFNFFSAFKLYSAFAAIYFTSITHSVALGITILSITQIADAIFEIPTGILSDRVGRKLTLIFGALARLISLVFYVPDSHFLFSPSALSLMVSRLLSSVVTTKLFSMTAHLRSDNSIDITNI